MQAMVSNKQAAIRVAYTEFTVGERERLLTAVAEHLYAEGFAPMTRIESAAVLQARACGLLPFDEVPTKPEPAMTGKQDVQDDDCADLLAGHGCVRCEG